MSHHESGVAHDVGLLGLRLFAGGLLAGHGSQKLFGWFEGHGLQGTGGYMEKLGMAPGDRYALMAGCAEASAGLLTALGAAWPIGPLSVFGPMLVASRTAHAGKPIWVTSGGYELPAVYMGVSAALALVGPGRFSADRLLGWRLPAPLVALAAACVAGGTLWTLSSRQPQEAPQPQQEQPASATPAAESVIAST